MPVVRISHSIGPEWLSLEPVRVGGAVAGQATPDRYVTLADDSGPVIRVDVYAYGPDCFAFQQAIAWRGHLVIGFGSHMHAVAIADRTTTTVELGAYFGHLYPTADYLLIASGDGLFRMEPDRSVLWTAVGLAVDGVVVHEPGPPVIRGEGEWDPPGGWKPFALAASDGSAI